MIIIDNKKLCCGCRACVNICPKECIEMILDEEGFYYPKVNYLKCISCGKCITACPIIGEYSYQKRKKREFYAAYSRNRKIVKNSSSGGIFSEIAEYIICVKKGVIYGAIQEGIGEVNHIRCSTVPELKKLRKSKYLQSNINKTYKMAKNDLIKGIIVLFSGTPCQIAGLYSFLGKNYKNLYSVDISCHGVPSKRIFDMYIQDIEAKRGKKVANIEWRDKKRGWYPNKVTLEFEDGKKNSTISMENPFQKGFLSNLYLRPSCYACKFSKLPRVADITLADFWGYKGKLLVGNINRGMSIVVVSTLQGENLFNAIKNQIYYEPVKEEIVKEKNRHIHLRPEGNRRRAALMNDVIQNRQSFQSIREKYLEVPLISNKYDLKMSRHSFNNDVLIVIGAIGYNRGSEMLLRGTIELCQKANLRGIVVSGTEEKIPFDRMELGISNYIYRYGSKWKVFANIIEKLCGKNILVTFLKCNKLFKNIWGHKLIIVVGADNFDELRETKSEYNLLISIIRKITKTPILLYDCSISKNHINKHLLHNILEVNAITARDKNSYENLQKLVGNNKLYYFPDPAFIVKPKIVETKYFSAEGDYIAINASSIIIKRNRKVWNAFDNLIEYILSETQYNILLLPHVMNNEDLSVLQKIYLKYKLQTRVSLMNDEKMSGIELKYLISKCRFFIGARTHASIAAYSMGIPSLVIGYSIKSKGIAQDLFGETDNYVIMVNCIKNGDELTNGFIYLVNNENNEKMKLDKKMQKYKQEIELTVDLLNRMKTSL